MAAGPVVYVHGNGAKPAEDELKFNWDNALFQSTWGDRSHMAYWADILHSTGTDSVLDARSMEELIAAIQDPQDVFDATLTAEDSVPDLRSLSPKGARMALVVTDRMLASIAATELRHDWEPEALPGPSWFRRRLFRLILQPFWRDVDAYLFGGRRDEICERLRKVLRSLQFESITVIAHSLGSVIAYDVLREAEFADANVVLFVTLGSPLGIQEIQEELSQPLLVCPPVADWFNFSDSRDVVALDKTLSEEFEPTGSIVDGRVINRSWNYHSATRYLEAPLVRNTVKSLGLT